MNSPKRTLRVTSGVLSLLLLVLSALPAGAATLQEQFNRANQHYWDGEYEAAQELYQDLAERYRIENPELYHNLANSYAKTGQLGAAVLYYNRALAAAPGPETRVAATANLERTRAALAAAHQKHIRPQRALFAEGHGVFYALFQLLSEPTLAVIFLALFFSLVAVLLLRHLPAYGLKRATKPLALTLLFLLLITGGWLAGNIATTESVRSGIVLVADTPLRATRLPHSPRVTLPEGLEVAISGEPDDGLLRVRLAGGREGFVPAENIGEI